MKSASPRLAAAMALLAAIIRHRTGAGLTSRPTPQERMKMVRRTSIPNVALYILPHRVARAAGDHGLSHSSST
jgi:hypothetical protein